MIEFAVDSVNSVQRRVNTIEKNTEALLVANMEICIEASAEKERYVFLLREQKYVRNSK